MLMVQIDYFWSVYGFAAKMKVFKCQIAHRVELHKSYTEMQCLC